MIHQFYKMLLFLPLLTIPIVLSGQELTITGKVSDENGTPVAGAFVVEDGTMNATSTDENGCYEIRIQSNTSIITYDCLGYDSHTETINGRNIIDIVMQTSANFIDDVVVIGYGTSKKANITGSVAAVDFEKQIAGRAIVNPSTSLSGLVAGLTVNQTSGQPGSDGATMRLRGTGTFSSSGNNPLILVDGIEWSINDINPNDIATITVLKDAASTAIYGTRAANGVILITSKQGKQGKAQISYSYSGVVQMPYNNLEFVTDYASYMELVNESAANVNKKTVFSQNTIDTWRAAALSPSGLNANGVPNFVAYPNTDWFEELFSTGYSQEHNLSVSGASEKIRYLISMNYLDNQGIMNRWNLDSSTQKFNFRTNIEADVTSWFRIGTRIIGQKQDYGMADIKKGFSYLDQTTPGVYPGIPDYWGKAASDEESPNANNIFAHMAGRDGYNTKWRVSGTVYAMLTPIKGLSLETTLNYSPQFTSQHRYSTKNGTWNYVTDERVSESVLEVANATNSNSRNHKMTAEILARYNATIASAHNLGILVGYSAISYVNDGSWAFTRTGATDWSLHEIGTYSQLTSSSSTAKSSWGLRSYFGRINYDYKGKYLVEANLRADGSSRFGKDSRYGFFPSFSVGWRISEEPFMDGIKTWLPELKLRVSWGQAGNNNIGNYAWQATYDKNNVVIGGNTTTGLHISSLSNNKLAWETTTTTNIGVDAGLFSNRLTAEIDAYFKNTSDILYTPPIYLTMGWVSGVPSNLGSMSNTGVELNLNWKSDIKKEFFYSIGINFSFNRNRVTRFKGKLDKHTGTDKEGNKVYYNNLSDVTASYNGGLLCEGHTAGEYYIRKKYKGSGNGYTGGAVDITAGPKDGIIRTETDMKWVNAMIESGYSFNGLTTVAKDQLWYGDLIYQDLNGDGNFGNDDDRDFTGTSAMPEYNLGVNIGFAWKGFDFNMVWSGSFGFSLLWRAGVYNSSVVNYGRGLMKHIADNHYFYDPQKPDDSRTAINAQYPRLTYDYEGSNTLASDFWEYKGDYFKLRNVQLGYTVPEHITRKFFVQKLRAYISMDNILTITSYPGLDPEIGTAIGYPLMKQISFGAQITF